MLVFRTLGFELYGSRPGRRGEVYERRVDAFGRYLRRIAALNTTSNTAASEVRTERFHAIYCEHFDFVYRNLRRLGVDAAAVGDALQQVFLVVLRRLDGLQDGTHPKTWLFAIATRVAVNYRQAKSRRPPTAELAPNLPAYTQHLPFDQVTRSEAECALRAFLDSLDDDERAVFVLVELEQMSAPEIAQALGLHVQTVYSRLRTARTAFEEAVGQLGRERTEDTPG